MTNSTIDQTIALARINGRLGGLTDFHARLTSLLADVEADIATTITAGNEIDRQVTEETPNE